MRSCKIMIQCAKGGSHRTDFLPLQKNHNKQRCWVPIAPFDGYFELMSPLFSFKKLLNGGRKVQCEITIYSGSYFWWLLFLVFLYWKVTKLALSNVLWRGEVEIYHSGINDSRQNILQILILSHSPLKGKQLPLYYPRYLSGMLCPSLNSSVFCK